MANLTPFARYQRDLAEGGFQPDAAQAAAVEQLQRLYDELVITGRGRWSLSSGSLFRRPRAVEGLYIWGGVGRGKTWLMDNFCESLPFDDKLRLHFHRFMRRVHTELRQLQGQKNPLETVAARLRRETRVLCFDEFFVTDITDAMLLGGLMQALFARGVTLVATSNIEPDGLYRDGLQRQRFLPAIELIKRHTRVLHLDSPCDYRLRALERAELYIAPAGAGAEPALRQAFHSLVPAAGEIRAEVALEVEGRPIRARHVGEDVAWFDFAELCLGPRSQNDYIELAREFHTLIVSDVPALGPHNDDGARRFISLVDELYDRRVKLILSADRPLESLYTGQRLEFEFQRTLSRLLEMQSRDYLARPHLGG